MLTDEQRTAIETRHREAAEAQAHANTLWRDLHRTVAQIYDEGQCDPVRTTNPQIGAVVGVSAQQVSRWRQKAPQSRHTRRTTR